MAKTPDKNDDLKTEKEKGKPDPAGKAKDPEKVEVLDIPANEPYPTGSPPEKSHLEITGMVPPAEPKTGG